MKRGPGLEERQALHATLLRAMERVECYLERYEPGAIADTSLLDSASAELASAQRLLGPCLGRRVETARSRRRWPE